MERARTHLRLDWLLVVAQAVVVMLVLGPPDVGQAMTFFNGGAPSAVAGVAVIACLLWVALAVLVFVVFVGDVRTSLQGRPRSSGLVLVALAVGFVTLASGWARHESSQFNPCCGELGQAQSLVEGGK